MNSEASLSKSKFERKDVLTGNTAYQDGDLIFQTSLSEQSKAIQLATRSIYSHCGLIFQSDTGLMVLEAVQPVKTTPLARWIARGQDSAFVVKRLSNASQVLTPSVLARMKSLGLSFLGKNYDLEFGWSDDKIYCSELIWKIYQRTTGLEIGRLQKLKEFNLADTHVLKTLKKRYGVKIPLNEPVVSPAAVFESALLITVATR